MKNIILSGLIIVTGLLADEAIQTDRYDIPFENEEDLDVQIEFGMGELDLRSGGDGYVLRAGLSYAEEHFKPALDYKKIGQRGKLHIYTESIEKKSYLKFKNIKKEKGLKRNHWRLEFSPTIPIGFDIDFGLGDGNLDFTGLRVEDLALECGMSDVEIWFGTANREKMRRLSVETGLGDFRAHGLGNANISRLNVECGLGSTYLSFEGQLRNEIRGTVTVGLGSVNIDIPEDVGVEIEAESSFLSSLDLKGFDEIDEDVFRSRNWGEARGKIYLTVEIGMGSIDVDWIE